jgi:hypothetical protein
LDLALGTEGGRGPQVSACNYLCRELYIWLSAQRESGAHLAVTQDESHLARAPICAESKVVKLSAQFLDGPTCSFFAESNALGTIVFIQNYYKK